MNTLTITNYDSRIYRQKIGRWVTVKNLRRALEACGHNLRDKRCLVKQTDSSCQAVARDNYVFQTGDEVEFTNAPRKKGAKKVRTSVTTIKIGNDKYEIEGSVLYSVPVY